MKIRYCPQRSDDVIEYEFEHDIVHVTYKDQTETFDFSGMPDGRAENIETSLPINPIIEAWRENGVLHVKLLRFHGPDAGEKERFPEWQEVNVDE